MCRNLSYFGLDRRKSSGIDVVLQECCQIGQSKQKIDARVQDFSKKPAPLSLLFPQPPLFTMTHYKGTQAAPYYEVRHSHRLF
ncbi:hypothetical protein DQX05_05545 [Paenibacillus thiaminolyticus]|uniref:Uncharacterized protein n=1 Tax=Paenibacillus thiaminolyticus TaxID=49283 RepID=A0A3A3H2J3_PANTH|nr:hypothetical protein DQX05_05545 [Paenibacillus thiaminolyticus]